MPNRHNLITANGA
ncbi:hypothetical protein GZD43_004090 [Vibrio alginolyticus]|nr:hypothetical protein [Vibrio alginolyticus]